MMKKIIFLEAVQNFGGARKSTVELASRLQNLGYEVIVVDFWGSCEPFLNALMSEKLRYQVLDKRNQPIILKEAGLLKQCYNIGAYFFKWLRYRKLFDDIVSSFSPDYVVVNNAKTASILKIKSLYKTVFFARGWFLPETISTINRWLFKKIVNYYVGVSQATRQAIYAGGYAKLEDIFVVPNAIDFNQKLATTRNWGDNQENTKFNIIHCGGFLPSKGQSLAVLIAKKLKDKGVNFKLSLVGLVYKGGQSQKYYDQIVRDIILFDLVNEIEIILNEPNVSHLFADMDVLIHPSETEGLPRVVMEAMTYGKPVIGNPVGGMLDYISHNMTGYITNHNSMDDYIKYILKLYNDKITYKRISLNCQSLIQANYTVDNQIESAKRIFK